MNIRATNEMLGYCGYFIEALQFEASSFCQLILDDVSFDSILQGVVDESAPTWMVVE